MIFQGPSPEKLFETFEQINPPVDARAAYRGNYPVPISEIGTEHSIVLVSRQEGLDSDFGLLEVTGYPFAASKKALETTPKRDYYLYPRIEDAPAIMLVSSGELPEDVRKADSRERRDARFLLLNILMIQRREQRKVNLHKRIYS